MSLQINDAEIRTVHFVSPHDLTISVFIHLKPIVMSEKNFPAIKELKEKISTLKAQLEEGISNGANFAHTKTILVEIRQIEVLINLINETGKAPD